MRRTRPRGGRSRSRTLDGVRRGRRQLPKPNSRRYADECFERSRRCRGRGERVPSRETTDALRGDQTGRVCSISVPREPEDLAGIASRAEETIVQQECSRSTGGGGGGTVPPGGGTAPNARDEGVHEPGPPRWMACCTASPPHPNGSRLPRHEEVAVLVNEHRLRSRPRARRG